MPLYEFKCRCCGLLFEKILKIDEFTDRFVCDECNDIAYLQISKSNFKVFESQYVRDIQDKDPPYVRNRQELTDAINRFNDTELASKQGKLAVYNL